MRQNLRACRIRGLHTQYQGRFHAELAQSLTNNMLQEKWGENVIEKSIFHNFLLQDFHITENQKTWMCLLAWRGTFSLQAGYGRCPYLPNLGALAHS